MESKSKHIKFFTYRGCEDKYRLRSSSPAADSKIDYIIEVLNRIGYSVELISKASSSIDRYIPSYVEKKGINTYRYFASLKKIKSSLRIFNKWFIDFQFFLWCLFNLKTNETVIVYHSLGYCSTFIILKKIKKIRIIGEIEEIYQDVYPQRKQIAKAEYKFIDICDKYLFPTILLNRLVNKKNKPFVIIHGLYSIENIIDNKFSDNKIHVVYGGTLDPQKGGATAAAAASAFLSDKYCVHICGFGDSTEIKNIIHNLNKKRKKNSADIIFEGNLKGNEYKHFIQKCHIGLSTQNPNAAFNATSFPSKILVYLSNGLKVVSIKIPVVEESAIADYIFFYKNQNPHEIAKAIEDCCSKDIDTQQVLEKLDKEFEFNLEVLLMK